VVEGARLESVYRPKAYRGFESLSLRRIKKATTWLLFLFKENFWMRTLGFDPTTVGRRARVA
jgi:hypothetical protein